MCEPNPFPKVVLYCGSRTNQFCRDLGRGIMKTEAKIDLLLAQEPLYRLMGEHV